GPPLARGEEGCTDAYSRCRRGRGRSGFHSRGYNQRDERQEWRARQAQAAKGHQAKNLRKIVKKAASNRTQPSFISVVVATRHLQARTLSVPSLTSRSMRDDGVDGRFG